MAAIGASAQDLYSGWQERSKFIMWSFGAKVRNRHVFVLL